MNIKIEYSSVVSYLTVLMLECFRIDESASNRLKPLFLHGMRCSCCVFPICIYFYDSSLTLLYEFRFLNETIMVFYSLDLSYSILRLKWIYIEKTRN